MKVKVPEARKIAITMGDPAGVGPEIIYCLLRDNPEWRDRVCVLTLPQYAVALATELRVECEGVTGFSASEFGKPTIEGAAAALQAMQAAAKGCLQGKYAGVVTGPISKHWCQLAGMTTPGQTEFFAGQWGGEPTMAFIAPSVRNMIVSLATWHIPLMDVKAALTEAVMTRCIGHTADVVRRLGVANPRIGVCGLNPHAGEAGQMGLEEIELLNPILKRWRATQSDVDLSDCLPADTLFYRHLSGEFDAVVALYHDQALAPVKTVAFHDAVNVTLGLPYVRTSPDHGTAFDIAGKGISKTDSFLSALRLAWELVRVIA